MYYNNGGGDDIGSRGTAAHGILRIKGVKLNAAGQLILQRRRFLFTFLTVKILPVYPRQG
jgi:hypothetical protein